MPVTRDVRKQSQKRRLERERLVRKAHVRPAEEEVVIVERLRLDPAANREDPVVGCELDASSVCECELDDVLTPAPDSTDVRDYGAASTLVEAFHRRETRNRLYWTCAPVARCHGSSRRNASDVVADTGR